MRNAMICSTADDSIRIHRNSIARSAQCSRRLLGRAGVGFVSAMAVVMTLAGAGAAHADVTIRGAKNPVFVEVSLNPSLVVRSGALEGAMEDTAARIDQAARMYRGRMITLRLKQSLTFDGLAQSDRLAINRTMQGGDPADAYEDGVANFLRHTVQEANRRDASVQLSVFSLPLTEASRSNARYEAVMDELDAFVTARSFIVAASASEAGMVEDALRGAITRANGRPVFYQSNRQWRMALGEAAAKPGAPAVDDPMNTGGAPSTSGGKEAQEEAKESNGPASFNRADVQRVLAQHGLPPALGSANPPTPQNNHQMAILALLAAWDETDSIWDLNGDGIVNLFDLLLLLADPSNAPEQDNGNDDDDDDVPTTPAGIARFVNAPSQYQQGSGATLTVELLSGAPANVDVVFQTWSHPAQEVQAPRHDTTAPFIYPAADLNRVTPGPADVQALIRDGNDNVLMILHAPITFIDQWQGEVDPDDDGDPDHTIPDGDDDDDPQDNDGDDDPDDANGDDNGNDGDDDDADDDDDDTGDNQTPVDPMDPDAPPAFEIEAPVEPTITETIYVSTPSQLTSALNHPRRKVVVTAPIAMQQGAINFGAHNPDMWLIGEGNGRLIGDINIHTVGKRVKIENLEIDGLVRFFPVSSSHLSTYQTRMNALRQQYDNGQITLAQYRAGSLDVMDDIDLARDIQLLNVETEAFASGFKEVSGHRVVMRDCVGRSDRYGLFGNGPMVDWNIEDCRFETTNSHEAGIRFYFAHRIAFKGCYFSQRYAQSVGLKPSFRAYVTEFMDVNQCEFVGGRIIAGDHDTATGPPLPVRYSAIRNSNVDHWNTSAPMELHNLSDVKVMLNVITSQSSGSPWSMSNNTELVLEANTFNGHLIAGN